MPNFLLMMGTHCGGDVCTDTGLGDNKRWKNCVQHGQHILGLVEREKNCLGSSINNFFFSCVQTESLHKYSFKKTLYNRIDMGRKQQLMLESVKHQQLMISCVFASLNPLRCELISSLLGT